MLFKLIPTPGKEKTLLAILEVCTDNIIMLYHASLFAGHQGVIKTYLTISDKFFIPNLMHYFRSYLKACHICQLVRNEKPPSRQLKTGINLNYRPMSRLSMDLKIMPNLQKRTLLYSMSNRGDDKLFSHSPNIPSKVRRNRGIS